MASSALARILALPREQFDAGVWGQCPWLSRAADLPRSFDDLLSLDDVDEIVAVRGLRHPFVRMAKNGEILATRRFTGPGGAGAEIADQLSADGVFAEMMGGATLVLQALHRTWPPLIDFVARLAAEIGHPVQANAYVTPARSRGFGAHHDVHDVFVLQVEGHKTWRIWPPVIESPLPSRQWSPPATDGHESDGPPTLEATLTPGDALYLPRGWVHSAESLGETAVHVTVGVHPVTRFDIVQALTAVLADDRELRRSLPLPLVLNDIEESDLVAVRDQMVEALEAVNLSAVAQEMRRRILPRSRPLPIRPLAQAAAAVSVDSDTWVRTREALAVRVDRSDDHVRLALPDRLITLPTVTAEAVAALLSGAPHQAGRLPGLDAADGVIVVRRLLLEAVLVPVRLDPSPAPSEDSG